MSDALREEIARAIAASLKDFHDKDKPCFALFLKDADAIMPIIARVRDEARDDFEDWLRGYDALLADSYRYDRDNGRL